MAPMQMGRRPSCCLVIACCSHCAFAARLKVNEETLKLRTYGTESVNATLPVLQKLSLTHNTSHLEVAIQPVPGVRPGEPEVAPDVQPGEPTAEEIAWYIASWDYASTHVKEMAHSEIAVVCFLVTLSSLVNGATGFGESIVFQWGFYVLSLVGLDSGNLAEASGILAGFGMPIGLYQVWYLRESLNWRIALTIGGSGMITCALGTFVSVYYGQSVWLKFSFGLFLLLSFLWQFWSSTQAQQPSAAESKEVDEKQPMIKADQMTLLMVATGLVCGLVSGIFATPGVVIILFALVTKVPKDEMRASFVFLAVVMLCPVRLGLLYYEGVVTLESLKWKCLAALPCALAGTMTGNYFSKFLSQSVWQGAILAILFASSTTFLLAPLQGK